MAAAMHQHTREKRYGDRKHRDSLGLSSRPEGKNRIGPGLAPASEIDEDSGQQRYQRQRGKVDDVHPGAGAFGEVDATILAIGRRARLDPSASPINHASDRRKKSRLP